ncbi:TrgA family protein [Shimia sediminis]|uniref:TrgA family protein n=1 Tax=Shimia sediminis TaxID=2497945 RepID=UPI000F8CF6AF|nr:TrgA family protein [Shimia sediminis]
MPTGSKLIGALCLGILGALVAELTKPQFPEGTPFGYYTFVCGGFGLLIGWRVLGARATGKGLTDSINNGITAVVAQVLVTLFALSSYEMIAQSMRYRYSDLTEALRGVIEIGGGYALHLLSTQVLTTLVIGAVLSGVIADFAYRHWR